MGPVYRAAGGNAVEAALKQVRKETCRSTVLVGADAQPGVFRAGNDCVSVRAPLKAVAGVNARFLEVGRPHPLHDAVQPALVQISGVGEDRGMSRFIPVEELFAGRHFDAEIVVLCVRWYLSFKLSYRDLVSMMSERGINLAHTTILRWVQRYTPEFEKRWKRYARPVGGSWRMDETYVKVRGEWVYLYRAVDKAGKTVDFFLSRQRDTNAAKAFLRKAMKGQRVPAKVTLDAYAASHRAVADLKESGELPKRVRVAQQQVPEQPDRARLPKNQTAVAADAGAEELSDGGHCDQRYRTCGKYQAGAVQVGQAGRAPRDAA